MHQLLDSKISIFVQDFHRGQGVHRRRLRSNLGVVRKTSSRSNEKPVKKAVQRQRKEERANGGCLGYPEAKKDVVSCEKSRGSANRT